MSDTTKNLSKFAGFFALLLVLAAGLIDLRKPFSGDQALFVTGARSMTQGAMLYRDFWDLKQPAIFGFYWLGLHLPGSPEVAVHLLELLYFLAFAVVMLTTLRGWFSGREFPALAAVLVCGIYFVICGSWHLTQVEGLVGFPLYLCAGSMLTSVRRMFLGRMFLAGIATGCIVMLKLMLVLLPGFFFLMMLVRERRNGRSLIECLLGMLFFTIGLLLVIGPVAYYFASHDQLNLLYATFIDDPMRITRELPHNPLSVFRAGLIWFVMSMGLLVPLACVGAFHRRKDLFSWGLVVWIAGSLAIILVQRKGWEYHFLLLLCPIGILATAGAERIMQMASAKNGQPARRGLAAIPVLLLLPYVVVGLVKAATQVRDPRPKYYAEAEASASVLNAPAARPGPIYVFGDPLIYYLSDRAQSLPINGWSPEWLLDDQWKEVADGLQIKRPAYVFVSHENQDLLTGRGHAVGKVLGDHYRKISERDQSDWYELK